ncbi:TPA: hypothetical protein N0F65_012057 [Lagenidium giganteum]|uniref:Retrotransposon gag domain-containing protein n=1 Tax=Lagenidium giganteum TaxID=4803 RepID=A0AAV2YU95_9STRA|nr:TPA: hypothetical protein N0F65_012057 [Lagenidium giganteum]
MEQPTAAQAASFAEQFAQQQGHFAEKFAQQQQAFAAQQQAARQAETSQGNMFEQFMYHLQLQNKQYQDQTQEHDQSKRDLMEEDTSTFATLISNNLGKTVLNWYREFSAQCDAASTRTINDYVSEFHNLLAQTEIPLSELEKRLYFQSGLCQETARKLKEESPSTLEEAVTIATNFEFAHFANEPPKKPNDRHPPKKSDKSGKKPTSDKDKSQNDWKKSATCHKGGKKEHIAPDCKSQERTETNNYISGSFYASLKVMAIAFSSATNSREVSIFIDNGCSLNGISEELARDLNLASVRQPKKTVEMSLNIPGFPILTGPFLVMPIPENNNVILGMIWLREQNPIIDWNALTLQPRASNDQ